MAGAVRCSSGVKFFAYLSAAWNVIRGFAGQDSISHAGLVGIGAISRFRATQETRGRVAPCGDVLDHVRPGQVISAHRSDLHQRCCLEAPA